MNYLVRRGGLFLLTLWAALTVNFLIPRVMPGNEASAVLATFRGVNPAALHALEIQFGTGVHVSVVSAYFTYLGNCLTGQFGLTAQGVPVMSEISSKLPWTAGLVGVTTILAFLIGTLAGIASAWKRGGRLDAILPPTLFIVSTVPMFFVGLLLIYVFGVKLNWLPLSSNYDLGATPSFTASFIWDVLRHALLPALSLVIVTAGLWVYSMRNNMITTISEDYVKTARAKGLTASRIMFGYAARNAILPNLTGFAMQLGYVLGGAIVIEYLFSYPGPRLPLLHGHHRPRPAAHAGAVPRLHARRARLRAHRRPAHRRARPPDPRGVGTVSVTNLAAAEAATPVAAARPNRRFVRAVLGNRKAAVGTLILLLMVFVAAFPGLLAPDSPSAAAYGQMLNPSSKHLLGTTQLGQDVFSQLIWSTRETLIVTLIVTAIATFLSTVIGVTSAYVGGITDRVLTVIIDVFLILPVLPLLILLAAYLPPGITSLTIVLCITSWAFQARQLRSQGLSIRNRDFLLAARARGERGIYIVLVEIVPTMTSLIAASFLSLAVYVVGFAASLQFLGLGNSSQLMWGTMLYNAQQASALEAGNAWWALAPGAAVALLGTGFALVNYAFDEIGNPALRPVRRGRRRRARASA